MATRIVMVLLTLTLALVIACGGAPAAPDPTATSPAAPASGAAPTTAPTAPVVSDTAQPTSTSQMAAPPAEVAVNPGKLTIMVGDLGNERFDQAFVGGTPGFANYGQIVHGALINSTEKRELVPGIATKWEMSPGGAQSVDRGPGALPADPGNSSDTRSRATRGSP
jgi:ABC-type transport system substrate-binding protein